MLNFEKRVVQYINTNGDDDFKNFLQSPFHINLLFKITDDNIEPIFEGWRGKNMLNWFKFRNSSDNVLEFYPEYYKFNGIEISIPKTINEFIEDSYRHSFDLFWNDLIDSMFEPKQYLSKSDIPKYFTKLLEQLDKSFELQI